MPMLCHRSYTLGIYACTRTCFVKVGVALCKLYPATDAHTFYIPAAVFPNKAGTLQA